jgi:hypothetical protein
MLLLLVASFGLLWILFSANREQIGYGRLSIRGALVLAYLAFELILLVITEATSAGHHLTAEMVDLSWTIVVLILLIATRGPIIRFARRLRSHDGTWFGLREHLANMGFEEWIWIEVVLVIFVILAVIGALYPPSNSDAMVYHLARVEHWIQNRTVAPYSAFNLPQVEFSPLAEYSLAHLHIMAGTDRFDGYVQLTAAVVSVVGVTELARLLGASRRTQIMAAVICATIPSGILLATTAENDYVAAAIGIVLLVVLAGFSFEGRWLAPALAIGAAAGLAYMTKSSMVLLIGPAAIVLLALAIYRERHWNRGPNSTGRAIGLLVSIPVVAAAVVAPFVAQNVGLFGSVVGPASRGLAISPVTIRAMSANVVRATASEFNIGNGRSGLQTYLARVVLPVLHRVYSIFGISQNDLHYSVTTGWNVFGIRSYTVYQRNEDYGANPWHVLLIVASLLVLALCVRRGQRALRPALIVAIGLGLGFLLFSGLYRWNQFGVRLILPLLVAWSALIAIALARFPRWIGTVVLIGLALACLPQLLDNEVTPLIPNSPSHVPYLTPYFANNSMGLPATVDAHAYETITSVLAQSSCTKAALGNRVVVEYPLWVALDHNGWRGVLNDFNVHNATEKLEPSYTPCASITQEGSDYVTPTNNTVNAQVANLAVSINADDATTIRTPIPGFSSSVHGVTVLPGGDWGLAAFAPLPLFGGDGSLYLFSDADRAVWLRFNLAPHVSPPTLTLSGSNGVEVPVTRTKSTLSVSLQLHSGVTRIDLRTHATAKKKLAAVLVLLSVRAATDRP